MTVYYEYIIDLSQYQTREVLPEVVEYNRSFRGALFSCISLSKRRNVLFNRFMKEVKGDGTLFVYRRPTGRIRGWCLMTARGKVQHYQLVQYKSRNRKIDWQYRSRLLTNFWYSCLNKGQALGLRQVTIRCQIDDYFANTVMDAMLSTLNCTVKAKARLR